MSYCHKGDKDTTYSSYEPTAIKEESELTDLLSALGVTDEFRIENIKQTAMSRFNVKKSKRKYIKLILDDAFNQLKEET